LQDSAVIFFDCKTRDCKSLLPRYSFEGLLIQIVIMVSKRTYTTSMVQFYIFSLIIDSVSCPDTWNQEPANPIHHHQDRHLKRLFAATCRCPSRRPPAGRGRRWGRGSGCDAATRGCGWGWRGACLGIASHRRRRRCPRVAKGEPVALAGEARARAPRDE
jgi:hypothetical protein